MSVPHSGTSETRVFDEQSPSGNDYLSEVIDNNFSDSSVDFYFLFFLMNGPVLPEILWYLKGLQRMGSSSSKSG